MPSGMGIASISVARAQIRPPIDITLTQDEVIRLRTLGPLSLIDQDGLRP